MCSGDSKFAYKDFYYVIDIVRRWNSHHPTAQRDTTTHSMDVKDMNHFPTPIIPHNLALIPHNNRLGIHHRNNMKGGVSKPRVSTSKPGVSTSKSRISTSRTRKYSATCRVFFAKYQ
jgi:hypothetical protein